MRWFEGKGLGLLAVLGATLAIPAWMAGHLANAEQFYAVSSGAGDPGPTPTPTAPPPDPTNPRAEGDSDPAAVEPGETTLLTAIVTPGTNPDSTGITVVADISTIGGSATQALVDDGTNGDDTAADGTYSYEATVDEETVDGLKTFPGTVQDAQGRSRAITPAINLTVFSVIPGDFPIVREGAGYDADSAARRAALGAPEDTCDVNTLADTGGQPVCVGSSCTGTFRQCVLGTRNGPRTVTFSVAGEIHLNTQVNNRTPYLTVDGSSAPSPGITLVQNGKNNAAFRHVATHDIVVHSIRLSGQFELGDGPGVDWIFGADGDGSPAPPPWDDEPAGEGVSRMLWSHVSVDHAWDDAGSVWCDARRISMNNMMLSNNFHPITTGCTGWRAESHPQSRHFISLSGNFFARNGERQAIFREGVYDFDYVNNMVYAWTDVGTPSDTGPAGYGTRVDNDENRRGNIVSNAYAYDEVTNWRRDYDCIYGNGPQGNDNQKLCQMHASDNLFTPQHNSTECVSCVGVCGGTQNCTPGTQAFHTRAYPLTILPMSEAVANLIIDRAGTRFPNAEELALKAAAKAALATQQGF